MVPKSARHLYVPTYHLDQIPTTSHQLVQMRNKIVLFAPTDISEKIICKDMESLMPLNESVTMTQWSLNTTFFSSGRYSPFVLYFWLKRSFLILRPKPLDQAQMGSTLRAT